MSFHHHPICFESLTQSDHLIYESFGAYRAHTTDRHTVVSPILIDGGGGRSTDAVVVDATEIPVEVSVECTLKRVKTRRHTENRTHAEDAVWFSSNASSVCAYLRLVRAVLAPSDDRSLLPTFHDLVYRERLCHNLRVFRVALRDVRHMSSRC